MVETKTRCPKCGEIEQVEITRTWDNYIQNVPRTIDIKTYPKLIEVYCNTCGKVSLIGVESEGHTSSAK